MRKIRIIISVLLVLSIIGCFSGCGSNHDKGNLKDNLIDGWDRWMQSFSKHALTKERNLQGEKDEGIDAYTDTYTAAYDKFNGIYAVMGIGGICIGILLIPTGIFVILIYCIYKIMDRVIRWCDKYENL